MSLLRRLFGMMLLVLPAMITYAQDWEVSGKVTDEKTGLPLKGVSVLVGKNKGLATKEDGTFSIKIKPSATKIIFSFIGYATQAFSVEGSKVINAVLQPVAIEQSEVVVIGYGTRKKSHLTGAVSKLTTDEMIGEIPVSRADDALKGKLAGVNITTTDAQAGAPPTIQIRGATSVTAGTSPLIVIDGYPVPTDLSAIDMNDVESIEVLKDAASAAIYGSRGGNGVILITSKSGKNGKSKLSVNVSTGIKSVYRNLTFPNLQEWKTYVAADNNGVIPAEITQAEVFDANTNAQDVIFRQVNFTNVQLSASGGNANLRYYLSGNYVADNGIMIGNDYKRGGLKAGFNAKVTPAISIDFSFTPSYTQFFNVPITVQEAVRTLPTWMPLYHNEVTSAATGMPVGSIANQRDFSATNPNYAGVDLAEATTNSPLQQLNGTTDKNTTIRGISNVAVKIELSKYLSFKATGGFLFSENTRDFFQKSWAQSEAALDGEAYARSTSRAILNKVRVLDVSNENILNYKRIINKHDIDVIAVFSDQYTNTSSFNGQAGNFTTDNIHTLNAGVVQALSSNKEEEALVSFLGRINYAYDNKYLLSVSQRSDGSSRFGPDNRFAFFPSVSAGWKISNENFFPDNRFLSDVKLRLSYGATGNKSIGNYRYLANVGTTYTVLGNEATPAFQLTSFGNESLGWERTYASNLGLDLGLFKNRVRITLDYYDTKTDRLLLNLPTAASTGFTYYTTNLGKVQDKGFEVEIAAPIVSGKNFKWDISANGYTNKNTLLDFGGTISQISQGDPKRANFFLTQVGSPLVQYYGYQTTAVVQVHNSENFASNYWPIGVTALHSFVKDVNGDGIITDADRVVLGNPYPKFNWGLTTNFKYKSLDVSITFQGSHGAKVFNVDPYYFETQFGSTGSRAYLNTDLYKVEDQSQVRIKTQTDYNIQDASFVALRNVNLGYIFPTKITKKIGLSRLRLYASSANLWYHFAKGYTSFNPEADNGFPNDPLRKGYQRGSVPLARTITFGINVDL